MARDDKLRVAMGKKRVERFAVACLSAPTNKGLKSRALAYGLGLVSPLARDSEGKPVYMADTAQHHDNIVIGNGLAYRSSADKVARFLKLDGGDKCRGIGDGYDPDAMQTNPIRLAAKPRTNKRLPKRSGHQIINVVYV